MRTGVATNGDVELFFFDEGDPAATPVMFVNGAGSPSVMWCRALIDPLLDAGFRVVRFDNRDLGRSSRIPADQSYVIADLADDVAAVMDRVGIDRAHLLGRSMGGMTIMQLAASSPDRVLSMTLIYTTPAFADAQDHGLPGPQQHILDAMAEAAFEPAPKSDQERIDRRVKDTQLYVGTRYPYDADWVRREAEDEVAHAAYAEPAHGIAVMRSDSLVPILGSLTQPALVLHGTADPIIDVTHGRFLADRLPNAAYLEYEGLGHEMPPPFCTEIIDPVLALITPE
ncbi:MAG: alpha/beta hydrolase [Actinomycetota bacterium]